MLVRVSRFWACPNLHGKLIPQPTMIARLAGVEFTELGSEERCKDQIKAAAPAFKRRGGGRTPKQLLDQLARGQELQVRNEKLVKAMKRAKA